jgi:hypothetical protein
VCADLANTEPGWHAALVHKLSEQQLLDMGKIYANAEQREQYASECKKKQLISTRRICLFVFRIESNCRHGRLSVRHAAISAADI